MNRSELLESLKFLKLGRETIVADYCTEEPRLYKPMFRYNSNSIDMKIALEKYTFSWLTQHPSNYKKNIEKRNPNEYQKANFNKNNIALTYRKLCEKFIISNDATPGEKGIALEKIVEETVTYLDSLLCTSEKSDGHLERLVYQSEKSRHLFERRLNELKQTC